MIDLNIQDICSEQADNADESVQPGDQDCHPVDPAATALMLPMAHHDSAGPASPVGSAQPASWTPISHGQLAAYASLVDALALGTDDVLLTQTSPVESMGVYQLVLGLLSGACMLPATASDSHEMVPILAEHCVTVIAVTADELENLLHAGLSSQV